MKAQEMTREKNVALFSVKYFILNKAYIYLCNLFSQTIKSLDTVSPKAHSDRSCCAVSGIERRQCLVGADISCDLDKLEQIKPSLAFYVGLH